MRRFLCTDKRAAERVMAERKRGMIRSYSLSYEAAEKIKSQLDSRDARLVIPEDTDPRRSEYKGLVLLSAPYCGYRRTVKLYSAPYLESGLPIIIMLNVSTSLIFTTPVQRRMRRVFDVVSANITESCPVVMKLYCGSISTFIPAAAKEFSKPGCKLKLVGAILDSGPPLFNPMSFIRASRFNFTVDSYVPWFQRMKKLLPMLFLLVVRNRVAFKRVMYSPFLNDIPQLYVYSATDDIINTDHINKLIDYQRRHNADVTRYIFSDTVHTLHRLKYPNEYDKILLDFLQKKCDMLT